VGGVGKTRLALIWPRICNGRSPTGVWLASYRRLRNAELLARTVGASLGLPDQAAGRSGGPAADYLAERHLL